MSYKFTAPTNKDYAGIKLYHNKTFEFEPGVTCLVGCNGSGKTTLLRYLQRNLQDNSIPVATYYGLASENKLSWEAQRSANSMASFLTSQFLSEGEKVTEYFALLVGELGRFVLNECKDKQEAFILVDSLDSGSSIDNIRELREFFYNTVIETKPVGLSLYIIIAVNDYEFARDCDCIDVQTSKHLNFHNYSDYVNYVMKTRKLKEKRIAAYQKAEAAKERKKHERETLPPLLMGKLR